jgi:hypothetical protein
MFNKFSVIALLMVILVIYLSNVEKLAVSIHSISVNGELNPRYALRPLYNSYPSVDKDLLLENFELLDQDENCSSLLSSNIINQYIDQSQDVVGLLIEYMPIYDEKCEYKDQGYLSILISQNPMAAYPRFPMYNFEEDFIIEGQTSYKIIQTEYIVYQNTANYHKYYASFKLNEQYIFIETKAYEVSKGTIVESLPFLLDSIYTALNQ